MATKNFILHIFLIPHIRAHILLILKLFICLQFLSKLGQNPECFVFGITLITSFVYSSVTVFVVSDHLFVYR